MGGVGPAGDSSAIGALSLSSSPPPTGLVARCGMIGLDMFICRLLKVHFLGPSRRRWGGLKGLAVDQLPQPLYMQHKY